MSGYVKAVDRVVSDLEMMQNPDWWPRSPLGGLPLKQYHWQVAMLVTSMNLDRFWLFENKTMFENLATEEATLGPLSKDELQQVIDRGWRVD